MFRVGSGFDVHRFSKGRKLILGGETIDFPLGLEGHSDADVVLHALCDALLGAAGLGDIGRHFPPGNPEYKDISSTVLLERVTNMLEDKGWRLENADLTLICEKPKIAPYSDKMRANIASAMDVEPAQISIKGTTTERLGFTGREEGIASMAIVLISKP
jgi:2-C-methyl-D-erythritol 2,4-cyclodiphosphate synthase